MMHTGAKYEPKISKLLVGCCNKIYQWHEGGRRPTDPCGFTRAPLIRLSVSSLDRLRTSLCDRIIKWILLPFRLGYRGLIRVGIVSWPDDRPRPNNFGVLYTSKKFNVLAFRGTEDLDDGLLDLNVFQARLPPAWRPADEQGGWGLDPTSIKVHRGFLKRTKDVRSQVAALCTGLEETPMYVTGHSLGAAVAVLVAVMLRTELKFRRVIVYTFAGPRVGNPAFARYFDLALDIPCFRVVNQADVIPELPPPALSIPLPILCFNFHLNSSFKHVREDEQWSFLNQTGNPLGNHALKGINNYYHCVWKGILSHSNWVYPVRPP